MPAIILANQLGEVGMPAAVASLQNGAHPIDVLEADICPVEADPTVPHVGIGGDPNMLGQLETDAAVMDGENGNVGVVGALKGYASAFRVARRVLDVLPHTMIVGEGAARFAGEQGLETAPANPEQIEAAYRAWKERRLPAEVLQAWPNTPLAPYAWPEPDPKTEKDTVIYLTRTTSGHIAGGTSTSGWGYKYPGRLGDSPIIGAGLCADSEYGACACTHTGEMTMRASTARSVVLYMKAGASVADACHEAVADLRRLRDGYRGPVVIHAFDAEGEPYVVATTKEKTEYWVWREGDTGSTCVSAVVDEIVL